MSTPTTPTPSPFVRGTTDTADVYYLQAALRRLIPDTQTLAFMQAGQAVRVLSDADLAVIKLGDPLPSRKNGQLLTQKYATPPPAVIAYYMANGQRRRIADIATQLVLVHAGSQIVAIEAADLTAIPEGPVLPTRADNTLYQGGGATYAYLMQSGQKRAFPDATTLRDAGFDFHSLAPISAEDLTFTPDGAAFPSTSRFLASASSRVPLVLLPVRLETRFQSNNTQLWLRVYPDDVHVDSFDPALTADEQTARTHFLAQAEADAATRQAAFAALARQFGPARAAWITSADAATAVKATPVTQPTLSSILPKRWTLPERWIVLGYQGNGKGQVLAVGPAIPGSLDLGSAADEANPTAANGVPWITNFDTAVQVGMAFRITLTPDQQRGFSRLVVLGLQTNLNAKDSAARLGQLLQAHHYTDGLELLAHNTPTNNTEDVSSGLTSSDPDFAALFALEQGPALCPSRSTADGDRLARALNIAPATFAHVKGAKGGQDEQAQAMNTVLWPATWGYYLGQIVTSAVPTPETILPAARDHFAQHVRARGHFPAMRLGHQPYGILPVCCSAPWTPLEGRALDSPLYGLLTRLRAVWEKSISQVPRIPDAQDPEANLVSLLGMTPSSSSTIARGVIGPEYNFAYWNFIASDLDKEWWAELAQKTLLDASDLAAAMAKTRLAYATYVSWHRPLSDVLVAPDPLDGLPAPAFVAQLAAMGWEALRDAASPAAPIPVLFLLLRHAALREYVDTALDLLTAANSAQPSERIEPEMVGFAGVATRPTAWDLLTRALGNRGPVGTVLDGSKTDATLPAFVAFWQAFTQLAKFSAADLHAGTREVLDLASYRLDSWITSFAHFRLDQLRTANPNGGIVLGAYGWLEGVRPQSLQASAGYVHAPSLNQATTVAVLRSGYLAHEGGPQKPFEIDLSSARVRLALHLLDGIREGQSLGALLGYRFERTLQERAPTDPGLFTLLDTLRADYPADAGGNDLNVVDGLALFRQTSDPLFWSASWVPAANTPLRAALATAISMLQDALDSVADLALTESVHQLIRGNTIRAGATLDSIARGDTPPLDIDFVQTPRSGTALTYRLMTVASGNAAPGWTVTPRAQAEPRLNAWAAALFGDPSLVRIRAKFVSTGGVSLANMEIGLNQLLLSPMDFLSMPETVGISGELANRIRRVIAQARPASVAASASIQIIAERDPSWKPQTIGLPEWLGLLQAVTRLVGSSRPMEPRDLVAQDGTPGAINVSELEGRADAAGTQILAARTALQNPPAVDVALLDAAAFGITGAVPEVGPTLWPVQVTPVLAELNARILSLTQLNSGFVATGASPDELRDHAIARLQTIFGSSFTVLPVMAPAVAAGWPGFWANSASLQAGNALASVRWMQQAARVRPGAALMDTAVMYAEALTGRSLLQLEVAQLPYAANDRWVGLPSPAAPPSSRLSLLAFAPTPVAAGAAIAGLMVDEWIDVWPATQQTTGVSFQYSDPVARAPQAILLGVAPDDFPEWTLDSVEGTVLEALGLAKIRGVDPDVLFGTVPPLPVDANVKSFQALSDMEVFVLGNDGNLWLEHAPFGTVPPTREQVDANVDAFQALSSTVVFVVRKDATLWLERGPFGTAAETRVQIDANVALVRPTIAPIVVPPKTTTVPALAVPLTDTDKISQVEAVRLLKAAGLVGQFIGLGVKNPVVTSQSPAAGTVVPIGSIVIVHLVPAPVNQR